MYWSLQSFFVTKSLIKKMLFDKMDLRHIKGKSMKKRQSKLFFSFAMIMTVPIVVLGVILVLVGQQSVAEGMAVEIQKSLAGTTRTLVDTHLCVDRPYQRKYRIGCEYLLGGYSCADHCDK